MGNKIEIKGYGSRSMRVLEALTPLAGTGAPAVHAAFIGQMYIDTTTGTPAIYISIDTDSASAATDWKKVTIS